METLLQRLSDDNPKNQDEHTEDEDKSRLIKEILMLLSSRPRSGHAEAIPVINRSIINYGVCDSFPSDTPRSERNILMQQRIRVALQRFEPRLRNVDVRPGNEPGSQLFFIIEADTDEGRVRYRLMWDDVISQFTLRD